MFNSATLIGFLTHDVEVRLTSSGAPVATVRFATNRTVNKGKENERQDAQFWQMFLWGTEANKHRHHKKGDRIMVTGYIKLATSRNEADTLTYACLELVPFKKGSYAFAPKAQFQSDEADDANAKIEEAKQKLRDAENGD